jgi:type IV pilus assembly protein PilY1
MKKLSLITARARVFSYSLFFVGCAALGFSSSALAVCTPTATTACIADQPIQSATIVKPNVMFVLDNSGSMTWTYMPDTSDDFRGKFGYHSSQCNDIYYDPATTYAPPKDSSNNDLPNAIFTSAKDSGFDATSTPRNLDSGFIANRFEPESANTDLKSFGSYLLLYWFSYHQKV